MRKSIIFLCVVGGCVFFAGIQGVFGAMRIGEAVQEPAVSQAPAVQRLPADLTVTAQYAYSGSYTREDGTKCYTPRPRFTITNKGHSDANNFKYTIEWKGGPGNTWGLYTSSNPTISLKSGAAMTIDGNDPAWEHPWCENTPDWIPGWRISADTENTVAESNESNNVAEIIFKPYMIKPDVPKAIPKQVQPAPMPKTKNIPRQMR